MRSWSGMVDGHGWVSTSFKLIFSSPVISQLPGEPLSQGAADRRTNTHSDLFPPEDAGGTSLPVSAAPTRISVPNHTLGLSISSP